MPELEDRPPNLRGTPPIRRATSVPHPPRRGRLPLGAAMAETLADALDDEDTDERLLREAYGGRRLTLAPQLGLIAVCGVALVLLTGLCWCVR